MAPGAPAAKKPKTDAGPGLPPLFSEGGYVEAGDGWWAHSGGQWLHNKGEGAYFHLPTGQIRVIVEDSAEKASAPEAEAKAEVKADSAKEAAAETSEDDEGPLLRGKVRWFNAAKGFGFIEPLDEAAVAVLEGKDVFVHRNQLLSSNGEGEDGEADSSTIFASLEADTEVTFRLGQTDNGRVCAVKVQTSSLEAEQGDADEDEEMEGEGEGGEDDGEDAVSEGSSVELDLFEEIKSGVHQDKAEGKEQIEDFLIDKLKIPVSVLGETATCVFFGVFDGHGGHYCAEFTAAHLAKNVLSRLRDRVKGSNDEVALMTALKGGFRQTEHNYLQHAKQTKDQSGTTACCMTVFGPDEQQRLRLFMANCGDSRAVLCRKGGEAVRLTEDHKPNQPEEKKRIEAAGGGVVEVHGVWRAMLPHKKRLASKIVGLAVSRAIGDAEFKNPNIISAEPDLSIHEVDWDEDEFVILATDGIWDVIPDKDCVTIVRDLLQAGKSEAKASEALCKRAREKGSKDDCTVQVVRFGWNSKSAGAPDPDEAEEEEAAKDGEEEEEEAGEDDPEEAEALAAMAAAMAANAGAVQGPADDDSDDEEPPTAAASSSSGAGVKRKADDDADIFGAADKQDDVDEEEAGLKRWDKSAKAASAPLESPLFDGLTPTREELEAAQTPAAASTSVLAGGLLKGLGSDDKSKEEEVDDKPPADLKGAVDDDMDMFG
eukprot:TRINITY_DN35243_c0_g1_i1.p1 TRINITY_DN35243_c0_g1~~TRINITY_DN35243_c0_g1_i1.p1  ORF type:complete len:711 (+),score=243.48 TRINITY_DN35243_c0_g1_i1:113-2245(+)